MMLITCDVACTSCCRPKLNLLFSSPNSHMRESLSTSIISINVSAAERSEKLQSKNYTRIRGWRSRSIFSFPWHEALLSTDESKKISSTFMLVKRWKEGKKLSIECDVILFATQHEVDNVISPTWNSNFASSSEGIAQQQNHKNTWRGRKVLTTSQWRQSIMTVMLSIGGRE